MTVVLCVVGGVLAVEVLAVGYLVVGYFYDEWRERRACMELTREFERMVAGR